MQLILKDISKSFGDKKVIDKFNLEVKKGEIVSLLGPSGCGKTTILKIIGGFLSSSSGSVILDGEDITNLSPENREVSTVFQSFALFPHMKVIDNVIYGLKFKGYSKKEAIEKGEKYLDLMGLSKERNRYPSTLSGGQKQRVALARSLILNPKLLLLDEALSSLDAKLRLKMRSEIKEIGKKFNTTMIFVTHDQDEALSISDKIAVMNNGCIEQIASPKEIYEKSKNTFVRNFIGECNTLIIDNKEVYLRPEEIVIEDMDFINNNSGITLIGKVHKIIFMGFYIQYEVMVEDSKQIVIVKSFDNSKRYSLEDKVKLCT